jgi:phosphoribosylformylglycinamidine synthase II
MIWRVEVRQKDTFAASFGRGIVADITDLKIKGIRDVRLVHVYLLQGKLNHADVEKIASQLLVDPIVEEYHIIDAAHWDKTTTKAHIVEVAYNTGVMDPTESSTIKGIRDLGIESIDAVRTARQYQLFGKLTSKEIVTITQRVLLNKLIQHAADPKVLPSSLTIQAPKVPSVNLLTVDILKASDDQLMKLSSRGQLYLNLNEMRAIKEYFKSEGRNPTDVELETIAQTWSEHCNHKTFRGQIRFTDKSDKKSKTTIINSLFKTTIAKVTTEVNKKWCISVFVDNAGVIAFDDFYHVCFKVETHNHPSALEPFGGANTGVGGVIRDTLGTGLGAKPLCNTDIFCFAPPSMSYSQLPKGALHPKRVMKGVISGVRDYGNKMGIPTVNGAIVFDKHFVGNPLVFCGNVGLIPKGKEVKRVESGDLIVALGGRTGRDGIHGATFSSGELTSESEVVSSGAVQIGNAIEEKKVADALLKARDENLYTGLTDCGAGGFSSAVGEMGAEVGAKVYLEKAPLKYQGLQYHEIWISESQERMVLSVPAKNINRLMKICQDENVEATVIGEFSGGRLQLFYHGTKVCDLSLRFIHEGLPKIAKEAVYVPAKLLKERLPAAKNLTKDLLGVMGHYNVASKESVIRVYDHEVQGTSVVKPLVGLKSDGPSDAAVLRPRLETYKGIAVANGINVRFGMIDPYWMAASCIDEAIRQIIAVGGDLNRIALLDNFCWGNPDKPDRLGTLVRCAQGCYTAAKAFGAPFISGKDSLYNEYTENGKSLAIPGTLLISSLGIIEDVRRSVTMDFKSAGNSIYILGDTADELGGSIYLENLNQLGTNVPKVNFKSAVKLYTALYQATSKGLVKSLHDCSEGGLGAALSEMAFAGGFGLTALLRKVPYTGKSKRDDVILFSESNSRLIAEVAPNKEKEFLSLFKGLRVAKVGTVESSPEVIIYGLKDNVIINTDIHQLKQTWQIPLRSI